MSTFLPIRTASGSRLQSGIPKYAAAAEPGRAQGLQLKGVVTATYVVDDDNHPFKDRGGEGPKAVYCDVLIYSNISGFRWRGIREVLVLNNGEGLHGGRIWIPRASKIDVTESTLDYERASNPANFDGDHVLIGFMNDSLNEPIIMGTVPHPSADVGNEESEHRKRLQLREVDGDPDFWKHHGSIYGIDDAGSYEVDTRYANDGEFEDDGKEKDPPTEDDDERGGQTFRLPLQATHSVTLEDMAAAKDRGEEEDGPKVNASMVLNKDERSVDLPLEASHNVRLNDYDDPDDPKVNASAVLSKTERSIDLPLEAVHNIRVNDYADPDNPKNKSNLGLSKNSRTINLPTDGSHSIQLNDLTDPDNPDPKVKFTLTSTKQEVEFVDSGLKVTTDDGGNSFRVDFNGGLHLLVDGGNNKVAVGGASDKACIDSAVQAELKSLRDSIAHLGHQVALHRHPPPEFPFPLLFGDIVACMKQPLVYLPEGSGAPINLRTSAKAKPQHAPMDALASTGEYVISSNPPIWHPDVQAPAANVFAFPTDIGATHSETVDLEP